MIQERVAALLARLAGTRIQPLDLVPGEGVVEKLLHLVLEGAPAGGGPLAGLEHLRQAVRATPTDQVRVVVLGGGTGLANLVGGDSRKEEWPLQPFAGLKTLFPRTTAVVCVTDDGGSTGELLKELPIIGIGDARHVLLAAIRQDLLSSAYGLDREGAQRVAALLHHLFNHRFTGPPAGIEHLAGELRLGELPEGMRTGLHRLLAALFSDPVLRPLLGRPHCLGNLLLVAAARQECAATGEELSPGACCHHAVVRGLAAVGRIIGAAEDAVLPCTTTPARLRIRYANGVEVIGEARSSRARRNCPVERVWVEFAAEPRVPAAVLSAIAGADIIVLAPGSLYTSIIPVLQVPGIAAAVRANRSALKLLVANLWAQRGETDLVDDDPARRYHVSDLIGACHRNVPGGVAGLFRLVLLLGMRNIPGSVLQAYAIEGKSPIYCDREKIASLGFQPVEARLFSRSLLEDRGILQHDPASLAESLRVLWAVLQHLEGGPAAGGHQDAAQGAALLPGAGGEAEAGGRRYPAALLPCRRYRALADRLARLGIGEGVRSRLLDILWRFADVPPRHFDLVRGFRRVPVAGWRRSQDWDNIFSFYDPESGTINIRDDVPLDSDRFTVGFLVALGQSLLGDYAAVKEVRPVAESGRVLGKVFVLRLRPAAERRCLLAPEQLDHYLRLARMVPAAGDPLLYTRLVNGDEGFTPPGLLFGLVYAWYLDNRFAVHIEYKMAAARVFVSDLIPEQARTIRRRQAMIDFFREAVFGGTP